MSASDDQSGSTLVYRRNDFDDGQAHAFPEDLRVWQPAVRLIRLVGRAVESLPPTVATTPAAQKLAAILIWCLATGRYSSWDIEALCAEEPLTRHLADGLNPGHGDIHRFRRDHEGALVSCLADLLRASWPGAPGSGAPPDVTVEARRRYERAQFADTIAPS